MAIDFYKKLPPLNDFLAVGNPANYRPPPEDWWVVITDVVNSTQAIQKGNYKEVNTAGAISIAALANRGLHENVPLVFGGDGISLLCPRDVLDEVKDIFYGTRGFVRDNFGLDLRIGFVSLKEVYAAGKELLVGKFSAANPFQQAIFFGNGLEYAEQLIKGAGAAYLLSDRHVPRLLPDYSGFSCPFRDIKSDRGPVLSLIVRRAAGAASYESIIREILDYLGPESEYYPIDWPNLRMGTTPAQLSAWTTVAARASSGFKFRLLGILFSTITKLYSLFAGFMKQKAAQNLPLFSDHRKFDGSLKMVISCAPDRTERLKAWLARNEAAGQIMYGLHESSSILITCLFNGSGGNSELHLIDGSDGGYALAALDLKRKTLAAGQK